MKDEAAETVRGRGLRARGKLERRRRLKEAAREVFLERGYDAATTREIAARADVAIGTLFVYAPEKRDLMFMIMNDELDALFENATRNLSPEQPLMRQLLRVFRPLYEYFESNVEIGRYGLREIFHFRFQNEIEANLGPEAVRALQRINRFRALLTQLLDRMKAEGRLDTSETSETVTNAMLWLHWCHIQNWLSDKAPKAEVGVARLRRLFGMIIGGLGPRAGEI